MVLLNGRVDPVTHVPGVAVRLVHVVGKLELVEVGGARLAVPPHSVLQRVLGGEAVHGDVVAVDLHSHAARVGPASDEAAAVHVVGAPEPEVVPDDVPGVDGDHRAHARLVGPRGAAHAGEDVAEHPRVFGLPWVGAPAPLQEGRGWARPRLQQNARHTHAVYVVGHRHGRVRPHRDEGGEPQAEQDLPGSDDLQGGVEAVDAGGEDHVKPRTQLLVDGGGVVHLCSSHVDLVKVDAARPFGAQIGTDRVKADLRDVQEVPASGADADERLLGHHGGGVDCDVREGPRRGQVVGAAVARGRPLRAHEDHVPDPVAPLRVPVVAAQILLLRAPADVASHLRVRHEPTAGQAGDRVGQPVLEQQQVPGDHHAPQGCGLRGGP
mmetsp:Transcript_49014/g.136738  ORF Transcript_49014/g.136738 Transcript_49014/m.136738 type:complete len:380 (+) Transcript_49014:1091-2230(+)